MPTTSQTIAVTLMTLISLSAGFRIRRSGVAGYDDPYGLTNAFSGMERQRRTDYSLLRKRVLEDDEPFFDPNSIPVDYLKTMPFIDEDNDSYRYRPEFLFEKPLKTYGPIDEYPYDIPSLPNRIYGPQKRTPHSSHRVVPTLEELRTIFGEADVPIKRLAPVKRQEPKQDLIPPQGEASKVVDKEARAEAVRKLLDAAEKLSDNVNGIKEIAVEEDPDNDGLLDIFTDAKTDENSETLTETKIGTDSNGDFIAEKEEITKVDSPAQSKSKRASNGVITADSMYVLELQRQIAELKQKVSKLEFLQMLEGKENDYLANALKFATLDQIEDRDAFVEKEYDDIAKATETEAIIQHLEDESEEEDNEEDDEVDNFFGEIDDGIPADDDMEKRSEEVPQDIGNAGQWLDNPVQENVGNGALLEGNDDDDDVDIGEFPLTVPVVDDDEDDDIDDLEEAEEESASDDQKHILADLLSNLSPSTVESIISDLQASADSVDATEEEVCPPVLDLSNHCAFADVAGIPVDDDARNLCERHQICYTCGSALGLTKTSCNEGYKGTVIADCDGDSDCLRDAAIFLRLMNRAHVYEPSSPLECKNPCVQDFIFGVAK